MEELFRFLSIRSADAVDEEDPSVTTRLEPDSPLRKSLADAGTQAVREQASSAFIASNRFITKPGKMKHGAGLVAVADAFRGLPIDAEPPIDDVLTTATDAIAAADPDFSPPAADSETARRQSLQALVKTDTWREARERLADSMLSLREARLQSRELGELADALRAADLLGKLADDDIKTVKPGDVLASTIFLTGVRETEAADAPGDDDIADDRPDRSRAETAQKLNRAMSELLRTPMHLLRFEEKEERDDDANERPSRDDDSATAGMRITRSVAMNREAVGSLTTETRATLRSLRLDPAKQPLDTMIGALRFSQKSMAPAAARPVARVLTAGTKLPLKPLGSGIKPGLLEKIPPYLISPVPVTKGHVAPAGVGDLLIVRQRLKRYEGGDVAHIENVLQGESKEREHRRRRYTETEFTTETEVAVSEERETQTTERFELGLETQRQASQDLGVGADVSVSASYGPAVQVEANTSFSYKNAKSESHKRSVQMSKEVVDKASTSFSQKVREQVRRKLVEEVEELNRHSLNAENAPGHIVGVYQWVDKVYEAQVFNYGLRVMYDFMVPEPAAWYIWSLSRRASQVEGGLSTPPPFELAPDDIYESNYEDLVALYEAKDVAPPPEPLVTVAFTGSGGPNPEKGPVVGADSVTVPEGYEYFGHYQGYHYTYKKSDSSYGFTLVVSDGFQTPGTVPIIYSGHSLTGWTAYVHVLCRRTDKAVEAWRQQVWNALHDGHRQQVSEYEEKLAALMAAEGIQIQGRNPGFNRKTERTELKKSCIALLSGSYPSWVNSVFETSIGPLPNLNQAEKQGAYVRFMEQAFEWENLTYLFYPYFWARVSEWESLSSIEDIDPMFLDFLTAGFARVVVPVRPGFEAVVEHLRQTGKVWYGGKMPTITDPDYLPIAEEMKAALNAPGDEVPVGDPWDVVVPTTLVKLRDDNALPVWVKQPDGEWVEG